MNSLIMTSSFPFSRPLPPPSLAHTVCHQASKHNIHVNVATWEKEGPMPLERLTTMLTANNYHGLLCTLNDSITDKVHYLSPNLSIVSTMSVGYDHIEVEGLHHCAVSVGHTPGVLTDTTADLVLALILATARRIPEAMHAVAAGLWSSWSPMWMCGKDLHHSTVGIVGLGRIGQAVARRLRGFGCKLLYSQPNEKPAVAAQLGATYVSFDELLAQSDFVVPQCPLTPETEHLFGMEQFQKMKRDGIFINTCRGNIVDQGALCTALKDGIIRAAGIDVCSPEPMDMDDELLSLDNCVVLPHIGSASENTRLKMACMAIDNIFAVFCEDLRCMANDQETGGASGAAATSDNTSSESDSSAPTADAKSATSSTAATATAAAAAAAAVAAASSASSSSDEAGPSSSLNNTNRKRKRAEFDVSWIPDGHFVEPSS
jgi:lactate dehydrogenase-like 2-hydroxyacid dehydrogenase